MTNLNEIERFLSKLQTRARPTRILKNSNIRWVRVIAQDKYNQETIAFIDKKSCMVHSVITWNEKGGVIGHVNDDRTMMAILANRTFDDERR